MPRPTVASRAPSVPTRVPARSWRFQLDFDERHFVRTWVDHVVLGADLPRVALADQQRRTPLAFGRLQQQLTIGDRHHDIFHAVAMPAGLGTGGEAPLGDD